MRLIWLLLLLPLGGTLVLSLALDELEIDAQVAPPTVAVYPSLNLWRSFMGQVRQVLHRWQPNTRTTTMRTTTVRTTTARTTTKIPSIQLRSTTEYKLEYYGALNPIFQMRHF